MAVLAATVGFTHLLAGFDNPTRQTTYDLRRLKRKGFIPDCRATTATNSPSSADASPCCSPRSTDLSSPRVSQHATLSCQPVSPTEASSARSQSKLPRPLPRRRVRWPAPRWSGSPAP
jgi:hypothetical protein